MSYLEYAYPKNSYHSGEAAGSYNDDPPNKYVPPPGWIESIGEYKVEWKEIKRPGGKAYVGVGHTMIGVLHTTQGDTIDPAYTTLAKSHSAPHFIAGDNRIIQCRPLFAQGAALEDGGLKNNASAALQIEMVGRSKLTFVDAHLIARFSQSWPS